MFSAAAGSAHAGSCEREIAGAAKRYDVPLAVFYAVGLNETGGPNGLQPYAMNIDGRPRMNASLADGLAAFADARRAGARLIDIGCMQINYKYHGDKFASVSDMFDPARNIDYAARFLKDLRAREGSWTLAVARYNAGPNNNPAQKKYVCDVIGRMVKSGFGAWTANAKAFCGLPDTAAPKAAAAPA
jgi:soluble lytic murein transglycosylase-like protein